MPQWTAGDTKSAAWGGSSSVVFKNSKHPYEASKFITWLNTSSEALGALNKEANLYPAATSGSSLPALTEGVPFYGNQKSTRSSPRPARNIQPFTWGPTMTQTYSDVSDGFGSAESGSGTLASALASGQTKTIAALKAQAIPVK